MIVGNTYTALACDLDGTILDTEHELRDPVRTALRQAADSRLHVILTSARPPRSVLGFSKKIDLEDPIIALNGALIMTPNQSILHRESMPPNDVEAVVDLGKRHHLTINMYSGYEWLVERIDKWVKVEMEVVKFAPQVVDGFKTLDCSAEKLLIMGEIDQLQRFRAALQKEIPTVNAAFSKPNFCEVTAKTVSKSQALKRICEHLGISLSSIIALGDGFNDMDMLKAAGLGVAMGNAPSEVKETADIVIGTNDEDGVAYFIRDVVLQKMLKVPVDLVIGRRTPKVETS